MEKGSFCLGREGEKSHKKEMEKNRQRRVWKVGGEGKKLRGGNSWANSFFSLSFFFKCDIFVLLFIISLTFLFLVLENLKGRQVYNKKVCV